MNKCKVILKRHIDHKTYMSSYSLKLILNNGIEITTSILSNERLLILLLKNLSTSDDIHTFELPFKVRKGSFADSSDYWIQLLLFVSDDYNFNWFLCGETKELLNKYINDFEVESKNIKIEDGVLTEID